MKNAESEFLRERRGPGAPGADALPVVPHQSLLEARRADGLLRDEQDAVVADREGAEVEELMMQNAESQAVIFLRRAASLVPMNVRSVEGDGSSAEERSNPHTAKR